MVKTKDDTAVKNKRHDPLKFNQAALTPIVDGERRTVRAKFRMIRQLAGGQPAGEKGLQQFVEHYLKIDPGTPEFDEAIRRIKEEELGEKKNAAEEGEPKKEAVYSINVIRSNETGPFLLEHMIKALLKQAASRRGIFTSTHGTKGDVTHELTVEAHGVSLLDKDRPWEVYLVDSEGKPVKTWFEKVCGAVDGKGGKKAIMTHVGMAPEGTEFEFLVRWPDKRLTRDDVLKIFATMTVMKIGSCLSKGYGGFEVVDGEIT